MKYLFKSAILLLTVLSAFSCDPNTEEVDSQNTFQTHICDDSCSNQYQSKTTGEDSEYKEREDDK